jgi:PTH1 family peptidyl-tRNA hydrolase
MYNLIVGLGNPGKEYFNSRHNVGFLFLDYLINKIGFSNNEFVLNKNFNADVFKYNDIILAKPMTFMNDSGDSIVKIFNYYKKDFKKIYVVYDDLDISFGKFKITNSRPKTHNGVNSVLLYIDSFTSIRIGIDTEEKSRYNAIDYVLSNFTKSELENLGLLFEEVFNQLEIS